MTKSSGDSKNTGLMHNLGPFLVGGTVLAVGLSLGGPSGYAINPARDFGPRLLGQLVGTQGLFDTSYWLIPIFAPIVGAVIGIFIYDWLVDANLPKVEPVGRVKSEGAAADELYRLLRSVRCRRGEGQRHAHGRGGLAP